MGTSMVQMAHKHVSAVGLQRGNTECVSCRTVIIASNTPDRKLGCTHICTHSANRAVCVLPEIIYLHLRNVQQ